MLSDLLNRSALRYPNRLALWVEGSGITYRELADAAGQLATAISAVSAHASKPQRLCGLLATRSRVTYVGVLAALLAGAAYVPLNPRLPTARLSVILVAASDIETVIVDAGAMATAEAVLSPFPRALTVIFPESTELPNWTAAASQHRFLCRADIEALDATASPAQRNSSAGAYLLFTSGSTGTPKGVLIAHDNVEAYLNAALARLQPIPEDRFTQLFDLSFDLSVHDMFVCWSAGACLFCPPASVVMSPRDFVRRHELTFWASVPSTIATMGRLRMLGAGEFPTLRMSVFCGEALPAELVRRWHLAAPNSTIENFYGPTETTIAITAYRVPNDVLAVPPWGVLPIGLPFPGQQGVVIDADGNRVGIGKPGELCLGGTQVARGYWHLPKTTAQRFLPPAGTLDGANRWYRTGDRVVIDPRWGLMFLGRVDRQVKVRGYRIELQEIEQIACEAIPSQTAAALVWPFDRDEPARHIVLFVAGEPQPSERIIAYCQTKLPAPLVPREVHFVADWPLNVNGKTDYEALKRELAIQHDKSLPRKSDRT
jgi:D-alanine--poly(phosphoribitol) ligase subunit 1